ncbi:MAG: polysaccharide pyruvyl transferase family protein [Clostridiaceae bacterium]|nr:polysaccharide pyruvyl transferase family protein [Clostridiaceae bacterium]
MGLFKKKILVFSRLHITNFGDPIIADCCKYIIEKTAKENGVKVKVSLADVYEKDMAVMKKHLKNKKAVVFPGGGLNSVVFNEKILNFFPLIEQQKDTSVFFNAIGILKINPKKQNEELLTELFNKEQVKQVTTRGDYDQLLKYIRTPKEYPCKLVFDPAIWVNEAYGIEQKPNASKIGIGVIRPEIFEKNGNAFSTEDVMQMYSDIIAQLNEKGYKWELFTNGMKEDYNFGVRLLHHLGLNKKKYLGKNVKNCRELVEKIASYKAVIAARLHANIIATSLRIPSVALVWNDKMNLFAEIIGEEERYLGTDKLRDASCIVHQLELAIENGYNEDKINRMKEITVETIKNIIN